MSHLFFLSPVLILQQMNKLGEFWEATLQNVALESTAFRCRFDMNVRELHALVDGMVESTEMALQMASWVRSLQAVQPLIVVWPLTENNQPVTTFPTPTLVLVNVQSAVKILII